MRRRLACLFLLWTAPLGAQGRITGTVYDSLITGGPLAQATVIVVGTTLFRVTDARGRFQIDSTPIGPLQLTFFHPILDSISIGAGVWDVPVGATGESQVTLATASGQTLRLALCPELADSTRTGLVMGKVRDVDNGSGIGGARISTRWLEVLFGPRGASSERFARRRFGSKR